MRRTSTRVYLARTASFQLPCSEPDDQRLRRGQHLTTVTPILIIYLILAMYRIGHQSFWVDEIRSLQSASIAGSFFSLSIWQRGQGPFYFAMLHLWGQLSNNEGVLRSLSVVFGSMSICLTYLMGVTLFNRRVGQIAAMILLASPFMIWYSQELRYITFAMATSLLAAFAFWHAVHKDRFGWWVLYVIGLVLAVGTLVTNVFLVVAHGLYLLNLRPRRINRAWLASVAVVFILFVWWANGGRLWTLGGYWKRAFIEFTVRDKSSYPEADRLVSGGNRDFSLAALPYTFFAFSTGFSLGPSLSELHVSRSLQALMANASIIILCAILFAAVSLLGIKRLWRDRNERMFFALWLTVPILATLGISAVTDMAYNVRYVVASLPAYVLILAAGIEDCTGRLVRIVIVVAILGISGLSLTNYYFNPRYSRADGRNAARYLQSVTRRGDSIIAVGNAEALGYYYRGDLRIINFGSQTGIPPPVLTERLRQLTSEYHRLWLVEIRPWETDPDGQTKAALDAMNRVVEHKTFAGVDIHAYETRDDDNTYH